MSKSLKVFVYVAFIAVIMLIISYMTLAAFSNGWKKNVTIRLEVVDKYGPHGGEKELTTLDEILAIDQLRVQSLQLQEAANNNNNNNNYTNQEEQVQIPAKSGKSLKMGSGNYVVTIGLGTPTYNLTLVIDTGSDVSWTQCHPCFKHDCFPQKEPMFRPSESSSYRKIPCESQFCTDLGNKKRGGSGCDHLNPDCKYIVKYGDGSSTTGFYGSDKLTLSYFEVLGGFRFGCGNFNSGKFGKYAGILGLGRGPASFVSQRKYTFRRVLSYCLPEIESRGFLSFGPGEDYNSEKDMLFTHFVAGKHPAYYYIQITAITVGRTRLPIPLSVFTTAGAIIDSGTVITRLPPAAYEKLAEEYKRQMGPQRSAPAYSPLLNTCFYGTKKDPIPSVSFTFKGDATIIIEPFGILRFVQPGLSCLAFAGNKNPGDMAIFGNTVQTKFEVMYDVPNNRLGFRSNPTCI